MIAWFRYICLIVSLIITMPELLSAQRLVSQRQEDVEAGLLYNESVYILSNYSCLSSNSPEKLSLDELLRKQIEGFYFYLKRDTETNVLLLRKPDGTFTPFSESLEAIKTALDADSTKVMTLFLDFYVETELESSFKEIGLMEYVLEYDTKNGWPSLKDMLSSGKRLVVFEVQKHLNSPSWLHNMRDFVEHTDADWGNQPEGVESFDERLKKNLSLFTGYKFLETSRGNSNDISALARQTPYLIESFKRAWIRDGRVPNFILVDKYYAWLDVSLVTFRNFDIIYGAVTNNNELLNYVNWDGMSNYTTGKYCFPLEPGAELMLSPISPGYRIEPATVYVSGTQRKAFASDFKARPLRIDEDIEIYLPFEGDEKDGSSNHNLTVSRNVEFIQDPIRGQVASLENQARVDLPTASELHMRDHDFTVGVWLKIPKYLPEKEDYCILGAKNSTYQQALHLLIRNRKPYMGFFNNDLVGNTEIEPGSEYYFFSFAYDAEGKLGPLQYKEFRTEAAGTDYDTSLTVDITLKASSFTSATFSVKRNGFEKGLYNFITKADFDRKYGGDVDAYVQRELIGQESSYPITLYSDNDIESTRLAYDTEYVLIALPEADNEDRYGLPTKVEFKTLGYEATGSATATIAVNSITDNYGISFYASVTVTPGAGCTGYYYAMIEKTAYDAAGNLGETICKQNGVKYRAATEGATFSTDYYFAESYLVLIPVDNDGKMSAPVTSELLTTSAK